MRRKITLLFCVFGSFFLIAQQKEGVAANYEFNDSIFHHFKNELEAAKKKSDPILISKKYMELGDFFQFSEVYTEAIEQYNLALKITTENRQDSLHILLNNRIAHIYLALKNYKKAKNILVNNITKAQEVGQIKSEAVAEGVLGSCLEKEGNYLEALEHQKNSLKLFQQINDLEGIAVVHENIGSIYEDLTQFTLAHEYFEKSLLYFENKNGIQQINVLNNIGDVYRKTGEYKKALIYTEKALFLAEKYKDHHQIESAHRDLAKNYALQQDHEKAYQHLSMYSDLKEEQFLKQNFRQLNVLQTIYETQQKETQIELLTKQNTINEANHHFMLLGGAALVFVTGISFFFINRKRKEKSKLQNYKQRMLQAELDKKEIEEKKLQDVIQLKTASLSKYSLNIAQKNKLITDLSSTLKKMSTRSKMDTPAKLKELAKELDFALQQEDEWDEFMSFFEDIHPQFFKEISKKANSKLTSAELRLAMLLRLNLSSKEIASILRVTPDSVRVARYRLRKKLPINSKQELVHFFMNL